MSVGRSVRLIVGSFNLLEKRVGEVTLPCSYQKIVICYRSVHSRVVGFPHNKLKKRFCWPFLIDFERLPIAKYSHNKLHFYIISNDWSVFYIAELYHKNISDCFERLNLFLLLKYSHNKQQNTVLNDWIFVRKPNIGIKNIFLPVCTDGWFL